VGVVFWGQLKAQCAVNKLYGKRRFNTRKHLLSIQTFIEFLSNAKSLFNYKFEAKFGAVGSQKQA
jgi:hypothetical protein